MVLSSNSSTNAVHSSNLNSNYKSTIFRGIRLLYDMRNGGGSPDWQVWVWFSGTGTRLLELDESALTCWVFGELVDLDQEHSNFQERVAAPEYTPPLLKSQSHCCETHHFHGWQLVGVHSWKMMCSLWLCDSRLRLWSYCPSCSQQSWGWDHIQFHLSIRKTVF